MTPGNDLTKDNIAGRGPKEEEQLNRLLVDPMSRRLWLLRSAAAASPSLLDALALAERVEQFVLGAGDSSNPSHSVPEILPNPARKERRHHPAGETVVRPAPPLTADLKPAVMARLADAATNDAIAAEFGLTLRQAQGFRMQFARQRKRNEPAVDREPSRGVSAAPTQSDTLVEDIVRYLRQQDDVVLTTGPGEFLVNHRFKLDFDQLLHRANRMRQRQGKPDFRVGRPGGNDGDAKHAQLCARIFD